MQRPLQPAYKIYLYEPGKSPSGNELKKYSPSGQSSLGFLDITKNVSTDVVYEEEKSLLNTLTFTIDKNADVLIERMALGQWVVFYGGYYSENYSGIRRLFSGTIIKIKLQLPDNGNIRATVTCMNVAYTTLGKDTGQFFVYPDTKSKRAFAAGKKTLTLKELIEGIAKEANLRIGNIALPNKVANTILTETNIQYQRNVSDWKFLNQLAGKYGCSVWIDSSKDTDELYFVDTSKAVNTIKDDISFLYKLSGTAGIKESEMIRFDSPEWDRIRLLWDVTVEEDISMAYAVARSASYFDPATGEQKDAMAEMITEKDGKSLIVFYELDEAKVEYVHKTDPALADKIRESGAVSWSKGWSSGCKDIKDETPDYARYYYKEIQRVDESIAVFDKAFFGIYVTASCVLDLNIRTQRSYNIRGLLRYRSSNKTGRYYLQGLKHIWDSSGARTELDFIR